MADEAVLFAVVPDHLASMAGTPLQHAPLLPSPGIGFAEIGPSVAVLQIHHSDADPIPGGGCPPLEVDLIGEHEAVRGIELHFVVIAEPVEFGAPRNLAHRGQGFLTSGLSQGQTG